MKIIFYTFFALFVFSHTLFAQSANDILGSWFNAEKDAKIEVYREGNRFFGKIVWSQRQDNQAGIPVLDDKNPDVNLQNRNIVGLNILEGFAFNSNDKQWENGTIYDPKSGKTYSCYMWLNTNGSLSIKGYIMGIRWLGRETIWARTK